MLLLCFRPEEPRGLDAPPVSPDRNAAAPYPGGSATLWARLARRKKKFAKSSTSSGAGSICTSPSTRIQSGPPHEPADGAPSPAAAKQQRAYSSGGRSSANNGGHAAGARTVSFLGSDSLSSSLPPSEFVFDVASRANEATCLPAAADDASPAAVGSAVAAAGSAGGILRPMQSAPRPVGPVASFLASRPSLRSSKSLPLPAPPSPFMRPAAARAAAKGAAAPTAPTAPTAPSLKRVASLSSDRSHGSSLLTAAFDRHDTRRVLPPEGPSTDTASTSDLSSTYSAALPPSTSLSTVTSSRAASRAGSGGCGPDAAGGGTSASKAGGGGAELKAASRGGSGAAAGAGAGASAGAAEGLTAREAAAVAAARRFSEAFLAALAAGDAKWGSDPRVSGLFAEGARMLTHDGQLFNGRTAIIRRLNAGMQQLHKMLGSVSPGQADAAAAAAADTAEGAGAGAGRDVGPQAGRDQDGQGGRGGAAPAESTVAAATSGVSPEVQALASRVHHTLDVAILDPAADAGRKGGSGSGLATLLRLLLGRIRLSSAPPAASKAASGGGGRRGSGSSSSSSSTVRVVATHTFKFGLRRFRLVDTFAVRQGSIVRLKRARG